MRIDFDSTWKDTTEVYFPALLELFEPQMLPRVADHKPVSFLDQEMQELAHALGDDGRAEVDVGGDGTVAAGSESQPYHGSRRGRRRVRRSGRLRVDKLVRAHLAALRTRHDLEARYTQRVALVRRLYEEGFSQKDVVFIHGLIDRLMILPRPLMIRFRQELFTIEKDKNMPYVDTLTRMSLQEGRQEGRQEGSLAQARESVIEALEIRFGEVSNDLRERITALNNLRTLKAQLRRAITVPSLDQF